MKKYPLFFLYLIALIACHHDKAKKAGTGTDYSIDYLSKKHGFYLGQSYDSVAEIYAMRFNFEADPSGSKKDTLANYFNISETAFINGPDSTEVIPSVWLTFHHKKLSHFECMVDYSPPVKDSVHFNYLLKGLAPFFERLKLDSNRRKLAQTLRLDFSTGDKLETYMLDTAGAPDGMVFIYETKLIR